MKKLLEQAGLKFDKSNKIIIDPKFRKIKIDIGLADHALHSNMWLNNERDIFKDTLVFGFEADPECVGILKDRSIISKKKIDSSKIGNNFYVIHCALGNPGVSGVDVVKLYKDPSNDISKSSLFLPRNCDSDDEEDYDYVNVPYFSLNHFMEFLPDNILIDYVKINTNGSDFNIIKGSTKYLNRILVLTFNSNNDFSNAFNNHYDIIRYLRNNNFVDATENTNYKGYNCFSLDPTFYNKNHLDKVRNVIYYQIGDLSKN